MVFLAVALLLTALPARGSRSYGQGRQSPGAGAQASKPHPVPQRLTLLFELLNLPPGFTGESKWELSYEWRIANASDLEKFPQGKINPQNKESLTALLSKSSVTLSDLTTPASRRYSVSIPVEGNLRRRLSNSKEQPQVVLLEVAVRVHDPKLGINVIRTLNPVWPAASHRTGEMKVRMEVTPDGDFRWFTGEKPPWDKQRQLRERTRQEGPPDAGGLS